MAKNETNSSKRSEKKEATLLGDIDTIYVNAEDSKLSKEFLRRNATVINRLAARLGVSKVQAVIFSLCVGNGPNRVCLDRDIASYLGIRRTQLLQMNDEIDGLIERQLVCYYDRNQDRLDVPSKVINALTKNEVYQTVPRTGLTFDELFYETNKCFDEYRRDRISFDDLEKELHKLIDDNGHLEFVQELKKIDIKDGENWLLLMFFVNELVSEDNGEITRNEIHCFFDNNRMSRHHINQLSAGEHPLMENKLVDYANQHGQATVTEYTLTDEARRTLLGKEYATQNVKSTVTNLLKADTITHKDLYYSPKVEQHVNELASFFDEENYSAISKRLKEKGMRQGFACLFYGGPGTGKTETALQLARRTGRDIMMVDIPSIRSMWVGESEKNVKEIFTHYRAIAEKSEKKPILFFNEADALICSRKKNVERAVDQMENTMQNIILQEMEQLDGIMIATTNLESNLDPAFERRFLYKLYFERPDAAARSHIWQSMLPDLDEQQALTLAKAYDFSGGQIENIARRYSIANVLYGKQEDPMTALREICDTEHLEKHSDKQKIGF